MSWLFSWRRIDRTRFAAVILGLSFRLEVSRRRIGPAVIFSVLGDDRKGLQLHGAGFGGFWLTWEMPWSWARRLHWPGSDREYGFSWLGGIGTLLLRFGHEPFGTHYGGGRTWRSRLASTWKNRELAAWRNTWIVGRDRHCSRVLDTRPVVIDCGRWPGDTYGATQTLTARKWSNRFRTVRSRDYLWDLPAGQHGIPVDTRGKWGDRYTEVFGFGAEDTGEPADVILQRRLVKLLERWPAGLVAEWDEVPA